MGKINVGGKGKVTVYKEVVSFDSATDLTKTITLSNPVDDNKSYIESVNVYNVTGGDIGLYSVQGRGSFTAEIITNGTELKLTRGTTGGTSSFDVEVIIVEDSNVKNVIRDETTITITNPDTITMAETIADLGKARMKYTLRSTETGGNWNGHSGIIKNTTQLDFVWPDGSVTATVVYEVIET